MERMSRLPFDLVTGEFSRNARLWQLACMRKEDRAHLDLEVFADLLGVQCTQDLDQFRRYKGVRFLLTVARGVTGQTVQKNQEVYREGDKCENLYIVLTGLVAVFQTAESGEHLINKIADVRPGDSLGLSDREMRSNTAIAVEDSRLLLIPQSLFLELSEVRSTQHSKASGNQKALSFFKALPLFSRLPKEEIERIASVATEQKAHNGDVILRQGESTRYVFFLAAGTVKLLRTIASTRKIIVIDTLDAGEMFGDVAAMRRLELQYTVLCTSTVQVFKVDREHIVDLDLDEFVRVSKPYPDDPKLLQLLSEKQHWRSYKRKIVTKAHREKQLSKVTWDSLLRSPSPEKQNTRLPAISWRHHVSLV